MATWHDVAQAISIWLFCRLEHEVASSGEEIAIRPGGFLAGRCGSERIGFPSFRDRSQHVQVPLCIAYAETSSFPALDALLTSHSDKQVFISLHLNPIYD